METLRSNPSIDETHVSLPDERSEPYSAPSILEIDSNDDEGTLPISSEVEDLTLNSSHLEEDVLEGAMEGVLGRPVYGAGFIAVHPTAPTYVSDRL